MAPDDQALLLEPLIPALRRYAFALTRNSDSADDLVQDCLERALSRWHLRRRDGDLRAWLFAILRNRFLSTLRSRAVRGPHLPIEEELLPATGGDAEGALHARDILGALDRMPEDQKSLLLLVGVEDLSYEEAARVLGIPLGTVMSRLSRARQRLRDLGEKGRGALLRRVK